MLKKFSVLASIFMFMFSFGCQREGGLKNYPVVIDYFQHLVEMIKAGGYDRYDPNISTDHFLVQDQGRVKLNIKLVQYNKPMRSDDVFRDLDSRGLRPATLPELLAFGATYPDKQCEVPVVALGSAWRQFGFQNVPYLFGVAHWFKLNPYGNWRELGLLGITDDEWPGGLYRFAAIRK